MKHAKVRIAYYMLWFGSIAPPSVASFRQILFFPHRCEGKERVAPRRAWSDVIDRRHGSTLARRCRWHQAKKFRMTQWSELVHRGVTQMARLRRAGQSSLQSY